MSLVLGPHSPQTASYYPWNPSLCTTVTASKKKDKSDGRYSNLDVSDIKGYEEFLNLTSQ